MGDACGFVRKIRVLAGDPDASVRRVAVDLARKVPVDSADDLLDLLTVDDSDVSRYAATRLMKDFPLLSPHPETSGVRPKVFRYFNSFHRQEQEFTKTLASFLKGRDIEPGTMAGLARLAGIRDLIVDMLPADKAPIFLNECLKETRDTFPRQLTIAPTSDCNLRCPYCANRDVPVESLSIQMWKDFLEWSVREGVELLLFCGGEATLHRDFPIFLRDIKDAGLRTYFSTNCMFHRRVLEALDPDVVDVLMIHVRDPDDDDVSPALWDLFLRNLSGIKEQGIPFSFRYNLYRRRHDFTTLMDLADEFGPISLQYALAVRGKTRTNVYVEPESLQEFVPCILEFIELCHASGYYCVSAKPLPPCLFGEETWSRLWKTGSLTSFCHVYMDGFLRNAVVNPDMTVSPCFTVDPAGSRKLNEFKDWNELGSWMENVIRPLLHEPLFEWCLECYLYHRGLCQGTCIANKV